MTPGAVVWYRVFGKNPDMPAAAAVLESLKGAFGSAHGNFAEDATGWYRADLVVDGAIAQLERYVAGDEGLRSELHSWAAWLETREEFAAHVALMEHMIQTVQYFTFMAEAEAARCERFCRFLAQATAGVYQIDGQGFFSGEGNLLVRERTEQV